MRLIPFGSVAFFAIHTLDELEHLSKCLKPAQDHDIVEG